jgi:CspA family cold shock protein
MRQGFAESGTMGALTFLKSLHPPVSLPLLPRPAPASRSRISLRCYLGVRTAQHHDAHDTFLHRKIDMTTNQTGTVKWFNEGKGYGFIAPDGGGKDLFAHFREIQGAEGYKTLAENARVQFDVTQGAKGPQASNIRTMA